MDAQIAVGFLSWIVLDMLFGIGAETLRDEASKQNKVYDPPAAVHEYTNLLLALLTLIAKVTLTGREITIPVRKSAKNPRIENLRKRREKTSPPFKLREKRK